MTDDCSTESRSHREAVARLSAEAGDLERIGHACDAAGTRGARVSVGTQARAWVRTGGAQVGDAHDGSPMRGVRAWWAVGGAQLHCVPWASGPHEKGRAGRDHARTNRRKLVCSMCDL